MYLLHTCSVLKLFHIVVCEVCEIWVCQLCPTFHPFSVSLHHCLTSRVQQGAQMAQLPMWQSPRGGKINILNEKMVIFCNQEISNYWAKEKGNSVNSCDFLKVDNLCKGWLLWLLVQSIKEPGHASLVLPKLIPVGLPVHSHLCHGTTVPIFVPASIVGLFWDFRILQDEGTIFLWNVVMC